MTALPLRHRRALSAAGGGCAVVRLGPAARRPCPCRRGPRGRLRLARQGPPMGRGRRRSNGPLVPRCLRTTPSRRPPPPSLPRSVGGVGLVAELGRPLRAGGARPSSSESETLPIGSMSSTCTSSSSPRESTSSTRSTRLPCANLESLEMCTSPSRPGRMLTKAPNLVMLTTLPR